MTDLVGRVALVTGGARGLGEAFVLALADAGCDLAVLARSATDVERVASRVRDRGRRAVGVAADVSDPIGLAGALDDVAAALGPVDVAVLNAGVIEPLGRSLDVDAGQWARALDVNVAGAFRVVRAVAPQMVGRGWGRLVTVSSGAASPPGMPSASAYSASKAALEMLTLHLARELGGTGVTANALRPGIVDTPMQDLMRSKPREQVGDEFYDRFHGVYERGELLPPRVPAEFLVRLLRTDITGRVLDVRDPAVHQLVDDC